MANKHLYNKLDETKTRNLMQLNFLGFKELAEATGLSITAIQMLVSGKTSPRPKNLKKICEALKCSQFDILENNEE